MNLHQCLKCKSEKLASGKAVGRFIPDNPRFLTLTTQVPVRATMCTVCGHIDLSGDVESLNRITGGKDDNT